MFYVRSVFMKKASDDDTKSSSLNLNFCSVELRLADCDAFDISRINVQKVAQSGDAVAKHSTTHGWIFSSSLIQREHTASKGIIK